MVQNLRQCLPKAYKLLQFFISFVTIVKSRKAPTVCKLVRQSQIVQSYALQADVRSHSNRIVNRLETICDMCGI